MENNIHQIAYDKEWNVASRGQEIRKINESSWSVFALLRFALSVVVFIGHLHVFAPIPSAIKPIALLGGKASVLGFLLISGLSIGYSYNKSKKGYFSRRFLRIYPLYFFAVLFTAFLQILIGSPYKIFDQTLVTAGWLTSFANFFFLQDFATITITYNGPLWSLAVEVFFYLLIPLLHRLPLLFVNILLLFSLSVFNFCYSDTSVYGNLALVYAWPWLLGYLVSRNQSAKYTIPFFILGIASTIYNKDVTPESLSWFTVFFTSFTLVMSTYTGLNLNLAKVTKSVFNYLGDISYPLYLFHFPLCLLFYYLGIRSAWILIVLSLVAMIPINYLIDNWLKKIFWKPVVSFISQKFSLLFVQLK